MAEDVAKERNADLLGLGFEFQVHWYTLKKRIEGFLELSFFPLPPYYLSSKQSLDT